MNEVDTYRSRLEHLRRELDLAGRSGSGDRVRIRDEIVALYRELERTIADFEEVKEQLRPMVEAYRDIFRSPAATATAGRADHLGSATYRERGWSALAGADYERAIRELRRAVEFDPENDSALALLAWTHLRMDDLESAGAMLEVVLKRQPDHPLAGVCVGYLRLLEGRFAEAIESLAPIAREGTDPTATLYANLYLGMVYSELAVYRDAQSFFERALALGPNLTEAHWELGRSYEREGRPELALRTWRMGAENRFSPWADQCREAAERLTAIPEGPAG